MPRVVLAYECTEEEFEPFQRITTFQNFELPIESFFVINEKCDLILSLIDENVRFLSSSMIELLRKYSILSQTIQKRKKPITTLNDVFRKEHLFLLHEFDQLDPCNYIQCSQGNETRQSIMNNLCQHYSIHPSDFNGLSLIVNRFHASSLLLDDIEDHSIIRRSRPCAHLIYGIPLTINAAYFAVFSLIQWIPKLFRSNHETTRHLILNACNEIHRGQGLDILWRENNYCPTEEEYLEMVRGKTSTPFILLWKLFYLHSNDYHLNIRHLWNSSLMFVQRIFPISLFNFFSKQHVDFEHRIEQIFDTIGIYFQIRDDYINLTNEEYWKKKGFCDDIKEKKFSYPIIRIVRGKLGEYSELMSLYKRKSELSLEDVHRVLTIILATDALEYTRGRCEALKIKIINELTYEGIGSIKDIIDLLNL